jgi:hypothetical protein
MPLLKPLQDLQVAFVLLRQPGIYETAERRIDRCGKPVLAGDLPDHVSQPGIIPVPLFRLLQFAGTEIRTPVGD